MQRRRWRWREGWWGLHRRSCRSLPPCRNLFVHPLERAHTPDASMTASGAASTAHSRSHRRRQSCAPPPPPQRPSLLQMQSQRQSHPPPPPLAMASQPQRPAEAPACPPPQSHPPPQTIRNTRSTQRPSASDAHPLATVAQAATRARQQRPPQTHARARPSCPAPPSRPASEAARPERDASPGTSPPQHRTHHIPSRAVATVARPTQHCRQRHRHRRRPPQLQAAPRSRPTPVPASAARSPRAASESASLPGLRSRSPGS
mmetsp:Transcript_29459/g.96172  ORF Transcript_29459/g.96172 Transcript_29459/m.96172 type:complete len:260 (+) Transcript_29459:1169-1948(+)